MDPKQITSLARLLKDNGDKVLNSEYQLSLSGPLLRALNDSFSLIVDQNEVITPKAFQVTKNYNAKSDVFRDLQFIYDFVQKTICLSLNLFANDEPIDHIDISKFRCLRKIKVHRISIEKIYGLKKLRPQLIEVHCVRSLDKIDDIISACGGDRSNGHLWKALEVADFSYNMLTKIDNSFEFTPMLQNLNLSNNKLVSVNAIKWLPNLKVLNLSFNRLTEIPLFHVETTRRLQVLLCSNNYVEDLTGISCLDGLTELDLSENCLLDHSTLLPLSTLAALQYLNLKGNPIECHPKHRQVSATYLHKNTSSAMMQLDGMTLSKHEKTLTGNYANYHHLIMSQMARRVGPSSAKFATPLSSNRSSLQTMSGRSSDTTPRSSVDSQSSVIYEHNKNRTQSDQLSCSMISQQQKKPKSRHIPLEDDEPVTVGAVVKNRIVHDNSKEHLLTKQIIEEMRQEHGEKWMGAENKVNTVLGFQNLSPIKKKDSFFSQLQSPTSPSTSEVKENSKSISIDNRSSGSSVLTSTPTDKSTSGVIFVSPCSPIADVTASTSDFKSVLTTDESNSNEPTPYLSVGSNNRLSSLYEKLEEANNANSKIVESDPEDNEQKYIVTTIDAAGQDLNDYFLIISDFNVKEKDADTGRTITRWSLEILESCESKRSTTITLYFDTTNKNKKMRTYRMSTSQECFELLKYLRNILSERDLCEMNQKVYSCAKCSTQFSREIKNNTNLDKLSCPDCKSLFVIEMKSSAIKPQMETQPVSKEKEKKESPKRGMQKLGKSSSSASIGSAGSYNDSQSSFSKISRSESSFDSNQSVAGSNNSERDKDIDLLGRDSVESDDIEILSNPSQSSIEVLDSHFSSRKTSEERRSISHRPSLDTIDDDNQIGNLSTTLTNQETSTHDLDVEALNQEIADLAKSGTELVTEPVRVDEEKKATVHHKDKRGLIVGGLMLTESSSSGSVTDSVCTAYEQNQGAEMMLKSADSETGALPKKYSTEEPKMPVKNEVSVITSMLGGLFQSTNLLMSKTPKSLANRADEFVSQLEPYKYSYTDFTNVDHRLKLYFFQTVFEDDGELMKWMVHGRFIDENQAVNNNVGFDGLLMVSTTKFYIFQIIDQESDDPSQWLKKHFSGTIDRICSVKVLPWKMGLTLSIKAGSAVHLLLLDIFRTDSLLLYLADNPLPDTCCLDYQVSERNTQKLQQLTNQKQIKTLTIFNECKVTIDEQQQINDTGALCVTETDLFLTQVDTNWLSDNNTTAEITVTNRQEMSNLIEVDFVDETTFKLNFMNENEDKFEMWKLKFDTTETAENTIKTISSWWEKIFGVPLINSNNNSSHTNGNDVGNVS